MFNIVKHLLFICLFVCLSLWLLAVLLCAILVTDRLCVFVFIIYRNLQRRFLIGSGGSRAANMASSKTFLSPFCEVEKNKQK